MPETSFSVRKSKPDFIGEQQLIKRGYCHVAGVDEVGRGPLAGPVVAAAVLLDPDNLPSGLDDSKRLTAKQRACLYNEILLRAHSVSVSALSARSIDNSDIRKCSLEAMRRAVSGLAVRPCYVLVDGRDLPPGLPCQGEPWIGGDRRSISIAAASVIAKVLRDRMMAQVGRIFPAYRLERHVGYATAAHRQAINEYGPIHRIHRYSFSPVRGRFMDEADDFTSK